MKISLTDAKGVHRKEHPGYEYTKRRLTPKEGAKDCVVNHMTVPPGMSPFPYHYHLDEEESFLILSGTGELRTPEGTTDVQAGDFLFFPAGADGAHKITNTSDSEDLVYVDFDTFQKTNVWVMPDSGKIGVVTDGHWGVYPLDADVGYFDKE